MNEKTGAHVPAPGEELSQRGCDGGYEDRLMTGQADIYKKRH